MSRYASDNTESKSNGWATEKMHWYARSTGEPMYEVPRADGKGMRPTTLKDARKLDLVPSVTTILKCADKPQLTKWIVEQAVMAALTIPRIEGESSDDLLIRIETDRKEQVTAAASRGTDIHAAIERHFRGQETPEWQEWVLAATAELERACGPQKWLPERSFASPLGYGGKVDLHSTEWVIDYKGKEGDVRLTKPETYDEHGQQLAAYRRGLCHTHEDVIVGHGQQRAGILFFGRDVPSAYFVEIEEAEMVRGWNCFKALLEYWRHKSRYFP